MKKFLRVLCALFVLMQSLGVPTWPGVVLPADSVDAAYSIDDNLGTADITYSNPLGIAQLSGMIVQGGVLKLASGALIGEMVSSDIQPASLSGWLKILPKGTTLVPSGASIKTTVLTCTGASIPGFSNLNFPVNLTTLNPNTYKCIKVKHTFQRASLTDTVSMTKTQITFTSMPILQTTVNGPTPVMACKQVAYAVNFADNYVKDTNVVLYTPLPSSTRGTITGYTAGYQQFPGSYNPTFVTATNGGMYTAGATTVNGVSIPSNSVYWIVGDMQAGDTKQYGVTLNVPCGTQTGTVYTMQSFIDGNAAVLTSGNKTSTLINSAPAPYQADIGLTNVLTYAPHDYRVFSGYSNTVGYRIEVGNQNGSEEIFNPSLSLNFSDVVSKLQSQCSVPSPAAALARITGLGGGSWSGTTYTYPKTNLAPTNSGNRFSLNSQQVRNFQIDYTDCNNEGDTFNVISTFAGDNIAPIVRQEKVTILTSPKPTGIFAKGHKGNVIYENLTKTYADYTCIGLDNDGDCGGIPKHFVYQGDTFVYKLAINNVGILALSGFHFEDQLPAGVQLVSTAITPSTTGLSYTTSIGGSGQLIADVQGCVGSPAFPATTGSCVGAPTAMSFDMAVKVLEQTGALQCQEFALDNKGFVTFGDASTNTTQTAFSGRGAQASDNSIMHVRPKTPAYSVSALSGLSDLDVYGSGVYSFDITNNGSDNGQATTVTIRLPEITVNNITSYLPISSVAGGVVDWSQVASGVITVGLGIVVPGQKKTITFVAGIVPKGIIDKTIATLDIQVAGNDNVCGPSVANISKAITLHGAPQLQNVKDRDFSQILQGGQVTYKLETTNIGVAMSSHSYVVDILPTNSTFVEAYTAGSTGSYTYSCAGCKVYFAGSNPALPTSLSPATPFTESLILANFVLGTQVGSGVWTSPLGANTKYIAYRIDDVNGYFPVDKKKIFGFKVQDLNTPIGGLIVNKAAVLSEELLQAISNPVRTTVLAYPSLLLDITSSKDIVAACEPFYWTADYRHDGSSPNTETSISVTLPNDTTTLLTGVNSITHQWNTGAVNSGAIAGQQDMSASPWVQVVSVGTSTIVKFDVTGYLSGSLWPGQGGTLRLKMLSNCSNASNTIMTAQAQADFKNQYAQDSTTDEDPVEVRKPDLWIRKNVDQANPLAGEDVQYTLTISNEGGYDASGASVRDTLPVGMCYVPGSTSTTTPDWSVGEPTISGSCVGGNQQTLLWTVADGNMLKKILFNRGVIPAYSEDIVIRYKTNVVASTPPGSSLVNGAHVENVLPEEPNYPNDSNQPVRVPFPDPYTVVEQPTIVQPGDNFTIDVKYGNNNRTCSTNTYTIYTVPNFVAGGQAQIQITSVVAGTTGQELYYRACPYATGTVEPAFTYAAPTSNGYTSTLPSNVCYIAIKNTTDLCDVDAQPGIQINAVAKDLTGSLLPAGMLLTGTATIYNSNQDDNTGNNKSFDVTAIPSFDLTTTIQGSVEGGYPGVVPGADLTYALTYENNGTVPSCQNTITVTLDANVSVKSPLSDFTVLSLKDAQGNTINPVNQFNTEITTPVPIDYTTATNGSGQTVVTFYLGGQSNYQNVCLPKNVKGSFNIFTTVKNGVSDSTPINASVHIDQAYPGATEITKANNDDATSTISYLADVMVAKSGIADSNKDGQYTGSDDTSLTNKGENIRYKIEYDNLGNTAAKNTIINEVIPDGTCFKPGTITPIPGTTVEYSTDNGGTWSNTSPSADGSGQACQITNFRVKFTDPLPAPSHYALQTKRNDWTAAGMSNTTGVCKAETYGVALKNPYASNSPTYHGHTADLNGDGKIDIIQDNPAGGTIVYYNNGNGFNVGKSPYLPGGGGYKSYTRDLNGDGKLDLIDLSDSQIVVHINLGGDQLTPGTVLTKESTTNGFHPILTYPRAWLNFDDLNNDGKEDIIAAGYTNEYFLGNGDGTFQVGISLGTDTDKKGDTFGGNVEGHVFANSADLNGDGRKDITIAGSNGQKGYVYLADGAGGFVTGESLGSSSNKYGGVNSYSSLIVDYNGDNKLDIIAVGTENLVYINDGAGGFATGIVLGGQGRNVFTGDFTNDGLPDLFVAGAGIFVNNGHGYNPPLSVILGAAGDVKSVDFDGDGKLDLISYNTYLIGSSLLLLGNGNGTFQPGVTLGNDQTTTGYNAFFDGDIGDFNGDGKVDVVGFNYNYGGLSPAIVYYNNGQGGFVLQNANCDDEVKLKKGYYTPYNDVLGNSRNGGYNRIAACIADFNGDNKADTAVMGYNASLTGGVVITYADNALPQQIITIPPNSAPHQAYGGDFNNDGYGDCVIADQQANKYLNLLGSVTGLTLYTDTNTYSLQTIGATYYPFDYNNDGYADLYTLIYGNNTMRYHESVSETGWTQMTYINDRNVIADFNGDRIPDLYGGQTIAYGYTGVWSFPHYMAGAGTPVPQGPVFNAQKLQYGFDYNNDGYDDLVRLTTEGYNIAYGRAGTGLSAVESINRTQDEPAYSSELIQSNGFVRTDYNKDGFPDIASCSRNYCRIIYGGGKGEEFYTNPSDLLYTWQVVGGDIAGDGYDEVMILGDTGQPYILSTNYISTGSYTTILSGNGTITSRDKLITDQNVPQGTKLEYTIYGVTAGGACDYGTTLLAKTQSTAGYLNIAAIAPSNKRLCVKTDFSTTKSEYTPSLKALMATWKSPDKPYFTFDVGVNPVARPLTQSPSIPNTVTISTDTPEITGGNNTSNYAFSLALTDLQLIKDVDATSVHAGDTIHYTLQYKNNGPQQAKTGFIVDTLPAGVSYVSISPSLPVTQNGQILTIQLGNLAVNQTGSVQITATITGGAVNGDIFTNTATIDSATAESNYTNNTDDAISVVGDLANVYTTIDIPQTYVPNKGLSGHVIYGNNGNTPAANTVLTITFDSGAVSFTGVYAASPSVSCTAINSYTLECNLGTLNPGVQGSVNVDALVNNDNTLLTSGHPIVYRTNIATSTAELDTFDNDAEDISTPTLGGLANLEGKVYLDVLSDTSYTTGDSYMRGVPVLLAGLDIFGTVYGPDPFLYPVEYASLITGPGLTGSQYVIAPPSVTDGLGLYGFYGLNPGTYATHIISPAGYTNVSSTGGNILGGNSIGQGSNNGGASNRMITNVLLGFDQFAQQLNYGLTQPNIINVANTIDAYLTSGRNIDVRVDYTNTTNTTGQNANIVIALDQNVVYLGNAFSGVYDSGTHTVTFAIGDLLGLATGHLIIQTQLASGYTIGSTGSNFVFDTTILIGNGPEITLLDNIDRDVVTLYPFPSVDLEKTPDMQTVQSGSSATFTITVTNNGDVPLINLVVTDPLTPACDITIPSLATGSSTGYTCTLANVASGFTNLATVQAQDSTGNIVTDSDTGAVQVASIMLSKTPASQTVASGGIATFTITVTNDGQLDLTNVLVTDALAPNCDRLIGALAVGASTNYTCQHAGVTGAYTNIAYVSGTTLGGYTVGATGSAQVLLIRPAIDIQKTPNDQLILSGNTATFTITVTNTGDVDLTNVLVIDPQSPSCARTIGSLLVGASTGYSCTTSALSAGFTNIAYVSGSYASGGITGTVLDNDNAIVRIDAPAIAVQKGPNYQLIPLGTTGVFTITVTNIGSEPLYNVTVGDPLVPNCNATIGYLATGSSTGYACSQANMLSGIINIAYASGTSTGGNTVTAQDDAILDVVLQNPSIRIIKTANVSSVPVGSAGTFTISVTNNGDAALTGVVVSDPLTPACNRTIGALATGVTVTYQCSLTAVNANLVNIAYVSGTTVLLPQSVTGNSSATITVFTAGGGGGGNPCTAGCSCTNSCGGGGTGASTGTITNTGTQPGTGVTPPVGTGIKPILPPKKYPLQPIGPTPNPGPSSEDIENPSVLPKTGPGDVLRRYEKTYYEKDLRVWREYAYGNAYKAEGYIVIPVYKIAIPLYKTATGQRRLRAGTQYNTLVRMLDELYEGDLVQIYDLTASGKYTLQEYVYSLDETISIDIRYSVKALKIGLRALLD